MSSKIHHSGPGEGAPLAMPDGVHTVKAGAVHTDGSYEVFEVDAPNTPMAPPHRAPWGLTCYLLSGTLVFEADGQRYELVPGAVLTVPPNTAVTFAVTSDSARFVAITTGDKAGKFFADMARQVPNDKPVEEILPQLLAVTAEHGVTLAMRGELA